MRSASMFSTLLNVIIVGVLCTMRITGHTSPAFQAVAHLYVGGLFTAAWWQWRADAAVTQTGLVRASWRHDWQKWSEAGALAMLKFQLAVFISLIELGCAVLFRMYPQN